MTLSLEKIETLLARQKVADLSPEFEAKTPASVAMILRKGDGAESLKLLYILRAVHANDPWSGNVAFPGGKVDQGEDPRRAAERETIEEIGLDLSAARYLGRMPEVRGSYLPVRVSSFVYWLEGVAPALELNEEVQDTFWADLADLATAERHTVSKVSFGGEKLDAPAIQLAWPGSPVLWGLTYRLTLQFLDTLQRG